MKWIFRRIISYILLTTIIAATLSFTTPVSVKAAQTKKVIFEYTGAAQTWTVPYSCWYTIELWGAQGGTDNGWQPNGGAGHIAGGTGAYVSAQVYLTQGEALYINVGGGGAIGGNSTDKVYDADLGVDVLVSRDGAGWNGGGAPTTEGMWGPSGGGGGATDIRVGDNDINSRIMIAGGGGGSSGYCPGEGAYRFYNKTTGKISDGTSEQSFSAGVSGLYRGKWQGQDQIELTAADGCDSGGGGGGGYYGGKCGIDSVRSAMGGLSFVGSPDDTSKGAYSFKNIIHVGGVKLTDDNNVRNLWINGEREIGERKPLFSASYYDSYYIRGVFYETEGWNGYAKITYELNTLIFDANGGTCDLTSVTVPYGSSNWNNVSGSLPVRDGYAFKGWYTSKTGGVQVYDESGYAVKGSYWTDSYAKGGTWQGNADLTVYARWEMIDTSPPVINISPPSADWCKNIDVTISITDEGGSGLSGSNSYQYYLSSSNTALKGGSWINYTSGTAFNIGSGLSGTYYIFVKPVTDNAGNVSVSGGTITDIGGSKYHCFGSYRFDNINPVINVEAAPSEVNTTIQVVITASDEGGSQLSNDNSYEYYLSTRNTSPAGGSWKPYTSGNTITLGEGLTGEYFLFVKRVKDNAGNWSNNAPYVISDGIVFDNTAPVISVNKPGCEVCKSIELVITASDAGTGLSDTNKYEYYLSTSPEALSGGTWISYTSGNTVKLGIGLNGTYYLFIRSVYDKAGNISTTEGTIVNIGSSQYHVFGSYTFDNKAPEGTVTYYENNAMLGLWDNPDSSPYAVMLIDDAADNISGIDRIYLELYDKANPDNKAEFDFTGAAPDYECVFNLYSALASSENIETIHMAIYAIDKVGNKGTLPITDYDFGTDGNGDPVPGENIGFKEDDTPGVDNEYERDAFRVEARIQNRWGETKFRRGDLAIVEIFTYGYVEYVDAYFNSLTMQINPQYDKTINLPMTDIPVKERYVYIHEFFVPLYAVECLYTDNVVDGYKKSLLQSRWLNVPVEGTILDDIKTILK